MDKKETFAVVVLFAALLGWFTFNKPKPVVQMEESSSIEEIESTETAKVTESVKESVEVEKESNKKVEEASVRERATEKQVVLSNELIDVTVSSWGGGISKVSLKDYRSELDKESGPVELDFSDKQALSLNSETGWGAGCDYEINHAGDKLTIRSANASTFDVVRTIEISDGYVLKVKDVFINKSKDALKVPDYGVELGAMQKIMTRAKTRGNIVYLGADTLSSQGGSDVVYWAKKGPQGDKQNLSARFNPPGTGGCSPLKSSLVEPLPSMVEVGRDEPTSWLAVKNKFFVQILSSSDDASGFVIQARRDVPESEHPANSRSWSKRAAINEINASLLFSDPERVLVQGETFEREMEYYVGPKKFSLLKGLGKHQDKVMFRAWKGWGWFRTICTWMLQFMNLIYSVIPNYGVAIILLTLVMKVVFWPITHKSTEGMKKMQKIQPLVNELKEKYKDNPQKMQQEQMALYKKHGVNPMSSCLPMVIQMPVFIAMFTVLRNAVELRYASFLWIKDLTEPEGLLQGVLPFPDAVNILPLAMAGTMFLQSKLSPQSADPQQRQMMVFMPVLMLVMLYNMAAGLMLYWTVSQLLTIAQLLVNKRKGDSEEA